VGGICMGVFEGVIMAILIWAPSQRHYGDGPSRAGQYPAKGAADSNGGGAGAAADGRPGPPSVLCLGDEEEAYRCKGLPMCIGIGEAPAC
jgi:hypothetical protein